MLRVRVVTAGSFLLGILPVCPATPVAYDIPPYTGQIDNYEQHSAYNIAISNFHYICIIYNLSE